MSYVILWYAVYGIWSVKIWYMLLDLGHDQSKTSTCQVMAYDLGIKSKSLYLLPEGLGGGGGERSSPLFEVERVILVWGLVKY